MSTTTTTPQAGAVRSVIAPHMFCLGSYRDMLSQDPVTGHPPCPWPPRGDPGTLTDWQHSHGPPALHAVAPPGWRWNACACAARSAIDALARLATAAPAA